MSRFSIFLPVRNGWPYVKDCVASILAQTHTDFELTILDNQSADETGPWLKTLADPRIRLQASESSLSIVESWARIKQAPKHEFMTMIGHDDLFDADFLATIQRLIDKYPDAALYQSGARLINADGGTIRACKPVAERETAADYLRSRFTFERDVFGTGYVMRSADYERLGGIPPFEKLFFADDALWLSLMGGSYKACDPGEHFSVRIHPKSESASLPSAWGAILRSLGQFNDFLQRYAADGGEPGTVVGRLGPDFLLAYHRNAYIYALVEACQSGQRIAAATRQQILASLCACTGFGDTQLRKSAKLAVLEGLNRSPLRGMVPWLWTTYYRLKTRAS